MGEKSFFKHLKENPMATAIAGAIGIHAAILSPQALEAAKATREAAAEWERSWFSEGTVIHPQTPEEQEGVRRRIAEREARIDLKALETHKAQTRKDIEAGKMPSFMMYFDFEQLYGVEPERVIEARNNAEKMIERFSREVGDALEEEEIQVIVKQMYGPEENYSEEQASVTEYFLTGRRNCDAIDRAQHIVFEGVISHLKPEEQARFSLGERTVKQHVIATLRVQGIEGQPGKLHLLEPSGIILSDVPEPGTVDVSADVVKRTTGGLSSLKLNAVSGDVAPSPDIDLVTNQPVPRGYAIEGALKGSDFVMQEARRRGLSVEKFSDRPMEVELLPKEEIDTILEHQRTDIAEMDRLLDRRLTVSPQVYFISGINNPTLETVAHFKRRVEANIDSVGGILLAPESLSHWSDQAIQNLFDTHVHFISFQDYEFFLILDQGRAGSLRQQRYDAFMVKMTDQISAHLKVGGSLGAKSFFIHGLNRGNVNEHISPDTLRDFLSAASSVPRIVLSYDRINASEIHAIVASQASNTISLSSIENIPYAEADLSVPWRGNLLSARKFLQDLSAAKSTIIVAADMYLETAIHYPDIITLPHITYDVGSLDVSTLQSLDRRMSDASNGPLSKHDRDIFRLVIQSGIDLKNGTMGSPM